jgi:hypothetical protein
MTKKTKPIPCQPQIPRSETGTNKDENSNSSGAIPQFLKRDNSVAGLAIAKVRQDSDKISRESVPTCAKPVKTAVTPRVQASNQNLQEPFLPGILSTKSNSTEAHTNISAILSHVAKILA